MVLDGNFMDRVQRAIQELKNGRMVILVDDEDRENEGDLVLAADLVTPESVNFMVTHARGLVCLALTEEQVKRLELPMMVDENHSARATAFTVSIEAREGVTTGISAQDRARTIQAASSPTAVARDIVSPGHIFPLRARPGGVLQRTGHTEGSIDLARLAGRSSAAVICEIMNDDGTMARLPDLLRFSAKHGLPVLTIEDLVHYRLLRDRLIRRVESTSFRPVGFSKTWSAHVYEGSGQRQFLALVLGTLTPEEPTLVRMHPGAMFADLFAPLHGHTQNAHGAQGAQGAHGAQSVQGANGNASAQGIHSAAGGGVHLFEAMHKIETEGRGVVVYIPPPRIDLAHELRCLRGETSGPPLDVGVDGKPAQREFGLGAQVLVDLGLRRIRIMTNNPRKLVGLAGYGLEVVEEVSLSTGETGDSHDFSRASLARS